MPYSNVPEKDWGKMEKCVQDVLDAHKGEEGFTKENAIAICHNRIVGGIELEVVTDPTELNTVLGKSFEPGELLRWKNAELARAEVNANMDELTNEDIDALAATLPIMPLTDEHSQIIGLFIAAVSDNAPDDPSKKRLLTDGVMYSRRFPDVAEEIQRGSKRLSIEAIADTAICSLCGGEFVNASEYCEHLQNRHASGASRRFKGIRAVGGGAVRRPAGSKAGFDTQQIHMIASHMEGARGEGQGQDGERQGDGGADMCVCPECGAKSKHEKGVPCSKQSCPKCGASMGGSNVSGSQEPPEDAIKSEGGMSEMERDEIQEKLDAALADLEGVTAERDQLESRVGELEASITELKTKLTASEEEREEAQSQLVWQDRSRILASVLDEDQLKEQKPVIMAMSDEAVALFVEAAKHTSDPPPKTPVVANLDEGDDDTIVVGLAA